MIYCLILYLILAILSHNINFTVSREVLELQAVNFELALTSYKYAAILFYDSSDQGQILEKNWMEAATILNNLHEDAVLAKIDGDNPEIQELTEAYSITIPCVKVFRRGIMSEYKGPYDFKGIAKYISEDSLKLRAINKSVVLGFFRTEDLSETDDAGIDTFSVTPWDQFQSTADSLRGHVTFFGFGSDETILSSFGLTLSQLPMVYMVVDDDDGRANAGMIPFKGEILESSLAEWILRLSSPEMAELHFHNPSGESNVLSHWKNISDTFHSKALFSYMFHDGVPDVLEYFNIDANHDLPMVAAYDPVKDYKFKSPPRWKMTHEVLQDFVVGVLTGMVKKVIKSEPIPVRSSESFLWSKPSHVSEVVKVVANNVNDVVAQEGVDVLLEVYTPWCPHCRKLMPTVDMLAKAVQAEPRIVIAKIDASANDLPNHWSIKSYPTLLWFPAKDKPYKEEGIAIPRHYWDGGQSLYDLVTFVQRQGSFDPKTLRIATSEQLGSLLTNEETLRAVYEAEERLHRRNEGRDIYENKLIDWFLGEIVFDGKRWHIGLGIGYGILSLVVIAILVVKVNSLTSVKNSIKKKK